MADPTQVVQYQTGLPPETALYGQQLLGQAAGLIYDYEKDASGRTIMVDPKTGQPTTDGTGIPKIAGFKPYQQYTGDRTAQFTPLQQQAFQAAQTLGVDPSTAAAARGLQSLAQSAAGTSYNAFSGTGPTMEGPRDVTTQGINAATVNFAGYDPFKGTAPTMTGPRDVSAEDIIAAQTSYRPGSITDAGVMAGYMSPYMQNVVDVQQQQAKRQAAIAQQVLGAQAARAGAFGGSGAALQRAQANAQLQRDLQGIQATGLQSAYQQGVQQFNAEQAAKQQLELSNLSNRQQAAVMNAANRLQASGMNQQAALQTAMANMQSQLQTQALGEQSRQYGAGLQFQTASQNATLAQQAAIQSEANRLQAQGMNQQAALATAQANLQARLQTQQLAEQSRQYGAGLGLQGLQTAMTGMSSAGQMGQAAFGQQQAAINLQNQMGTQQQQQMQNILNQQYQDFQNAQNMPYRQLGFMSDMIRGLPMSQTSSAIYQAPPTATQNLLATGMGVAGISSLLPRASGGVVSSYAGGGSVLSRQHKESILDSMHPYGLPRAMQGAQLRGDIDTYNAAQSDMATDEAIRRGIAAAAPYDMNRGYARGGIVAFSNGDWVQSDDSDMLISREDAGLDSTETNDGSPGNAGLQQRYTQRLMGVIDRMEADKGYVPLTAQERRAAENIAYQDLIKTLGPDIYAPMRKSLGEQESGRSRALEQGKGMALLEAASAVLQPGGTARGLGAAGAAFGRSYGRALEADRAEQRNIAQMQFNLADAERKERLGLTKEARASVQAAEAAGQAAAKNRRESNTAIANALGRGVQATRPAAARAPGSGPKLNEQLAAAEIEFERNPTPENQKTVTALRRAVAQTKTTDVGPTRATIMGGQIFSKASEAVQKIVKSQALMDQRYLDAMAAGDADAIAAVLDDLTTKQMKRQGVTPGAGTSVSADPLGIR